MYLNRHFIICSAQLIACLQVQYKKFWQALKNFCCWYYFFSTGIFLDIDYDETIYSSYVWLCVVTYFKHDFVLKSDFYFLYVVTFIVLTQHINNTNRQSSSSDKQLWLIAVSHTNCYYNLFPQSVYYILVLMFVIQTMYYDSFIRWIQVDVYIITLQK